MPAIMEGVGVPELAIRILEEMPKQRTSMLACVGMSLLAGLSTTLGAAVVFLLPGQRVTPSQMAFVLALAGGVMLSVTILEFWIPMLSGGKEIWPVLTYSLLGAAAFYLLALLVPEPDGLPHHAPQPCPTEDDEIEMQRSPVASRIGRPHSPSSATNPPELHHEASSTLQQRHWRLSLVLMISLTAHNFPEGFAVAISALQDKQLGLVVTVAIAMHNIPEGIAIAVPVLAATGSRSKALWMSFLSGMAEPVGALTALFVVQLLGGSLSDAAMENLLCAVGGVMCAVAVKELLPEAWRQRRPVSAVMGVLLGFVLMWVTIRLGA
ncbi:unnamed protein product [Polarella glacialis]|uniref:Uncharacterized protein n=1 Tax=Polarella glacialis TaxID=89957 RepID=A0A813HA82_POLGL|nr:unnamed protein product [Polarella glacialis]CAE8719817.1 unnamed protein product [Polarella glacialis]